MTALDDLLLAAHAIGVTWTTPELVLAAWRAAPARFGLKGCRETHPDSNRVIVELVRLRSKHGLVERVAPSTYRLTEKGRWRVARLLGSVEASV